MSPNPQLQNRRRLLKTSAIGFGHLALSAMLQEQTRAADALPHSVAPSDPLAAKVTHFGARAKRVIFLFMKGGPSHVDTFDPKP
ncbi:MAG TPA: DUF1501 domain-containing protein, partial [Planctomycetaceae bacterium]|nr:DUF1501 domain-containing protein [Planctomycetaceae bacterium]